MIKNRAFRKLHLELLLEQKRIYTYDLFLDFNLVLLMFIVWNYIYKQNLNLISRKDKPHHHYLTWKIDLEFFDRTINFKRESSPSLFRVQSYSDYDVFYRLKNKDSKEINKSCIELKVTIKRTFLKRLI